MLANPLTADLDHVLAHTQGLWAELRGQRVFITGGTGFFGCWLLESFCHANDVLGLGAKAMILTRNPKRFEANEPRLAHHPAVLVQAGDCRWFDFPKGGFAKIIHAATERNPWNAPVKPATLLEANVQGTQRVLEFAKACGGQKLLFTSSGAVCGRQPSNMTHLPEDYPGAPLTVDLNTAFGQSKRISEFLWTVHGQEQEAQTTIARCFTFVGPQLPLDENYAVGNFTRDALAGGPIRIHGDGTPYRSHLYAADLAIWLWTILLRGQAGCAYNVGSDADLTIAQLARLVAEVVNPGVEVITAQASDPAQPPQRYVPSIERARKELGLEPWIPVREGVRRMAEWQRQVRPRT